MTRMDCRGGLGPLVCSEFQENRALIERPSSCSRRLKSEASLELNHAGAAATGWPKPIPFRFVAMTVYCAWLNALSISAVADRTYSSEDALRENKPSTVGAVL